MKLKLVGATKRYNFKGELFLALKMDGRTPLIYIVDDEKGTYLLEQYDPQTGFGYFEEYVGEEPGIRPGMAEADEKKGRVDRPYSSQDRRRPSERAPRAGRNGPRPTTEAIAKEARYGQASSPIDEDTAQV